ncbi:hypothetical protein J4Q44_G00044670 [Coregonus suidteri]|uniref:Lactate/malate dehydrogenase C-terminal domain-containing protein n=1 Tax=Coregonus suidteri TaxID=861788 RepID=A0AAN8M576_9TELE
MTVGLRTERVEGRTRKRAKVRKVSERYQQLWAPHRREGAQDVAVIVAGNSLVNLKCSLLLENAPSVEHRTLCRHGNATGVRGQSPHCSEAICEDCREVLSLGILSTGQYNLPAGVVFSMPVSFQDGRWSVLSDVIIGDEKRAKLQIAADQLREEKDLASRTRKDTA